MKKLGMKYGKSVAPKKKVIKSSCKKGSYSKKK